MTIKRKLAWILMQKFNHYIYLFLVYIFINNNKCVFSYCIYMYSPLNHYYMQRMMLLNLEYTLTTILPLCQSQIFWIFQNQIWNIKSLIILPLIQQTVFCQDSSYIAVKIDIRFLLFRPIGFQNFYKLFVYHACFARFLILKKSQCTRK